jgi:hypothetical protein
MDDALYLLGFSPKLHLHHANRGTELQGLYPSEEDPSAEGIDSNILALLEQFGIEKLEVGPVWAWFKRIERADFEGPAGEKNLADIHWLTPRVIAHEKVVDQLSLQSTFYPARFGTLFSNEARLTSFVEQFSNCLLSFFQRVKGKKEWGLKLFGNHAQAAMILAEREGIVQQGVPVGGAKYLKLKQLQRESSKAKSDFFTATLHEAIQSLGSQFSEMIARPIHATTQEAPQGELLKNIAILASNDQSNQILSWAERWNNTKPSSSGIQVELTGPWPAYSFCPSLTNESDNEFARRAA